jgi:hypothetical protein
MVGMARSTPAPAAFATLDVCDAGPLFGGAFFAASWLNTEPAATPTAKNKINKRLRSAEFIPNLLHNIRFAQTHNY